MTYLMKLAHCINHFSRPIRSLRICTHCNQLIKHDYKLCVKCSNISNLCEVCGSSEKDHINQRYDNSKSLLQTCIIFGFTFLILIVRMYYHYT